MLRDDDRAGRAVNCPVEPGLVPGEKCKCCPRYIGGLQLMSDCFAGSTSCPHLLVPLPNPEETLEPRGPHSNISLKNTPRGKRAR